MPLCTIAAIYKAYCLINIIIDIFFKQYYCINKIMQKMLEAIWTFGGIVLIVLAASIINRRAKRKRQEAYISQKFGTVPADGEIRENVSKYYEIYSEPGDVDEVTWNDLSMDDIFTRINQCDTSAGEEILYYWLHRGQLADEEYMKLERRIEAAGREKERLEIERELMKMGKGRGAYFIPVYMNSLEEYGMRSPWLYQVLQILFFAAVAAVLIFHNRTTALVFWTVFFVNLVLYGILKMRYEVEFQMIGTAVGMLRHGKNLLKKGQVAALYPELKENLEKLEKVTRRISLLQGMQAGSFMGDAQGILLDYLLGITMWQVVTYNKVIRSLSRNEETYMAVYRAIGELDMAISIASYRHSVPWYCIPEFSSEKKIEMEALYHPLLEHPVENSLSLERGCIITGSNASGKSTFIKAAALSAILGQTIHTCTARQMRMPKLQVITSMAVKDDLAAGESYFIREIRYLKRILDSLTEERIIFCAIDEILRGTNTGERIRASSAILKYLSRKNCIALVASHDKELTEILADEYENYHFSEEIGEEDIYFSYKIQKGPATSQNGIKLLEFAEFPDVIIKNAKETVL